MDKQQLANKINVLTFIITVLHVCGIIQIYFFIPALLEGDILSILITGGFAWWMLSETTKSQYHRSVAVAEYNSKFGEKNKDEH